MVDKLCTKHQMHGALFHPQCIGDSGQCGAVPCHRLLRGTRGTNHGHAQHRSTACTAWCVPSTPASPPQPLHPSHVLLTAGNRRAVAAAMLEMLVNCRAATQSTLKVGVDALLGDLKVLGYAGVHPALLVVRRVYVILVTQLCLVALPWGLTGQCWQCTVVCIRTALTAFAQHNPAHQVYEQCSWLMAAWQQQQGNFSSTVAGQLQQLVGQLRQRVVGLAAACQAPAAVDQQGPGDSNLGAPDLQGPVWELARERSGGLQGGVLFRGEAFSTYVTCM